MRGTGCALRTFAEQVPGLTARCTRASVALRRQWQWQWQWQTIAVALTVQVPGWRPARRSG
ncbi:hypothetical protein GCM10009828_001820 [Actinoplanes couchii]|uniref:Uncharacterized protein n=1 Tax=Actinoplanes couchii TaxID=403638 RepID=A0ABQ3XT11_9ACTN|nr:hypothetical protein Aco03nite_100400 [Actinoplanes couchii]